MADDLPTTSDLPAEPAGPVQVWATRIGLGVLGAILCAAALGFFGPSTGTGRATGGAWTLDVTWPKVTRAGMPAPLQLEVRRAGGFDGPVEVTICAGLFNELDFQNWYPAPSSETGTPERVVYEFDPPKGNVLRINLDARTAPGQFGGIRDCSVTIREEGRDVLEVPFTTWRMP